MKKEAGAFQTEETTCGKARNHSLAHRFREQYNALYGWRKGDVWQVLGGKVGKNVGADCAAACLVCRCVVRPSPLLRCRQL